MANRNYLVEGVSGTGKTSVATELQRRGFHVIHGDRELAYQGHAATGTALTSEELERGRDDITFGHRHHLWDVARVKSLIADQSHPVTFFCGGSRNFPQFIDLFDGVFVLDVDPDTLKNRLANRPADEFGARPAEMEMVLKLHQTREDIPANAITVDATMPLTAVVDAILSKCGEDG